MSLFGSAKAALQVFHATRGPFLRDWNFLRSNSLPSPHISWSGGDPRCRIHPTVTLYFFEREREREREHTPAASILRLSPIVAEPSSWNCHVFIFAGLASAHLVLLLSLIGGKFCRVGNSDAVSKSYDISIDWIVDRLFLNRNVMRSHCPIIGLFISRQIFISIY